MDKLFQNGKITFVGTPLGNLKDISLRALDTIANSNIIAVEDTRRLSILKHKFKIKYKNLKSIIVYNIFNEKKCSKYLINQVLQGCNLTLMTDSGMPNISDPGYALIRHAVKHNIQITVSPGPCSISTALSISGLPSHKFCFEGFLPKSKINKEKYIQTLISESRTMIFFESAKRIQSTLKIISNLFGENRYTVIAKELTKLYEEVIRGTVSQLIKYTNSKKIIGEIVLIIAGCKNNI